MPIGFGRLEYLDSNSGIDVYVDYAHTPESVTAVLEALAPLAGRRRRVVVLGCSQNSDKGKRPLMARAAVAGSEHCILTSDNPGSEHPAAIISDMMKGVTTGSTSGRVRVILDRCSAIEAAIQAARPDGVVVLLGKGTETVQLIQGQRIPHSDRQVAQAALRRLSQASL